MSTNSSRSSSPAPAGSSGWREALPQRLQWGLMAGAAALLGTGYALERWLGPMVPHDQSGSVPLGWDSIAWFVWLLAAPAMFALVRRLPEIGGVRRNIPRLAFGCASIYAGVLVVRFVLRAAPNVWRPDAEDLPIEWHTFASTALATLPMDFLTCGGILAAAIAVAYAFRHREQTQETLQLRLRTAQLESELAQAELSALRGQLHPHFLFNSFNAVSTLVRQRRNEAAVEMIARLSELLRFAIDRTGQQELRLEQELDFIRRYLEIERVRFGEKLQLEFSVADETLPARVPTLVLQPFVENAIKHGISRRTSPGRLAVMASRSEGRLRLTVENDGADPGSLRPAGTSSGIGVANTRQRLDKLYGPGYRLDLIHRADGGMSVRLDLPFVTAGENEP